MATQVHAVRQTRGRRKISVHAPRVTPAYRLGRAGGALRGERMPNSGTLVPDRQQRTQTLPDQRGAGGFSRTRDSARCVSIAGFPHAILATGEETAGRYAAIEITVPQNGPPAHTHTREDECF